jgi:hypothetical protein
MSNPKLSGNDGPPFSILHITGRSVEPRNVDPSGIVKPKDVDPSGIIKPNYKQLPGKVVKPRDVDPSGIVKPKNVVRTRDHAYGTETLP